MNYLTDLKLDAPAQEALSQAASQKLAEPRQSTGKSQAIGSGAGTILGVILGSMAGNPMAGASIGGSLGGTVGSMIDPANRRDPQKALSALTQADKLYGMYLKGQKPESQAMGDFLSPVAETTSMVA